MAISRGRTSSIIQGGKNTSMLAGYPPRMAAPTATNGVASASLSFTTVAGATSYTVISNPGNITATGTTSPINVTGLTAGTAYTFRVSATNSAGTGDYSAASNSVTPINLIVGALNGSPYTVAYPWSGGFGTRYSNPATLPAGISYGAAFNRQTNTMAICHDNLPRITTYPFTVSGGYGTKFADPATSLNATFGINKVTFNPTNNVIMVSTNGNGGGSGPFMHPYAWSSSGFGTKYGDAGLSTSVREAAFRFDGNVISLAEILVPRVFNWTNASGFGTQYTSPASLPPGTASTSFRPQGDAVGYTFTNASPWLAFYPWSNGFGTRYGAPASLPNGTSYASTWHPTGNFVIINHTTSPNIAAYNWSGGFGSRLGNPATLPGNRTERSSFNTAGDALAVTVAVSPNILVYDWSSGFGTKYADPASLPTYMNDVTFI